MEGEERSPRRLPRSLYLALWVSGADTKGPDVPSPVCAGDMPGAAQAWCSSHSLSILFSTKGPFRPWSICL